MLVLLLYLILTYSWNTCIAADRPNVRTHNTSTLESKVNGFYIQDSFKLYPPKEPKGSDATSARELLIQI